MEVSRNSLIGKDNASYGSTTDRTDDLEHHEPETQGKFSRVPHFAWIEICLLSNVFLSGFDTTVTASIYTTIGNEFNSVNLASWITTSYLITSTSMQPLYGSFSDVLGRRICVFVAISVFTAGCVGCCLANSLLSLNIFRAVAGIGGGGLVTLATVINSDIVPTKKRGLFQAFQNLCLGMGSICGASFGGVITETLGWRWCFILQLLPCIVSFWVGYLYIQDQPGFVPHNYSEISIFKTIDLKGSFVLVTSLTIQVVVLSMGGNEWAWLDWRLITLSMVGVLFTGWFIYIENFTIATPIIPIQRFCNLFSGLILLQNFLLGMASLAYLFILPLLFQFVLEDSPSKVGLRLAIPSLSTPIGSIITGTLMNNHPTSLKWLVVAGTFIMSVGNFLVLLVSPDTSAGFLNLLLIPANLGQGMAYPSCLFTFVFAFPLKFQASSTSTIYLLRSIGGVWGVSCASAIIQSTLKSKLFADFQGRKELAHYSEKQIYKLIDKISKSTDTLELMPSGLRKIVMRDYEEAIRLAQLFSSICCTVAFVCCIVRGVLNAIPKEQPRRIR